MRELLASWRERLQGVEVYIEDTVGKVIEVTFAVEDNFTARMVRDGAFRDIGQMSNILWAIGGLHDYTYCFIGTFPVVDKYGRSSVAEVIVACLSPDDLSRINWNYDFWWDNLPILADPFFLHPDLRD